MVINEKLKIFFFHCGCVRRLMDITRVKKYVLANGCIITNEAEEADYVFVTTCGSFSKNISDSYDIINHFKNINSNLIILGCLPDIDKLEFENKYKYTHITPREMEKLDNVFPDFKVKFSDIKEDSEASEKNVYPRKLLFKSKITLWGIDKIKTVLKNIFISNFIFRSIFNNKSMAFRICYGCPNSCAYCIIKRATGRLKSRSVMECINEYNNLIKKGYRTIHFISEDVGAYGIDIGSTFPLLLNKLIEVNGTKKIKWKFSGVNPNWVIKYKDELKDIIKKGIITDIGIPVQSGSNRILKLMNRDYEVEAISDILLNFKMIDPKLIILTHIIIGFPTETEEDFKMSLDFLKKTKPDRVLIFKYTENKGTMSENITPKVTEETINLRYKRATQFMFDNHLKFFSENNTKYNFINKNVIKSIE